MLSYRLVFSCKCLIPPLCLLIIIINGASKRLIYIVNVQYSSYPVRKTNSLFVVDRDQKAGQNSLSIKNAVLGSIIRTAC